MRHDLVDCKRCGNIFDARADNPHGLCYACQQTGCVVCATDDPAADVRSRGGELICLTHWEATRIACVDTQCDCDLAHTCGIVCHAQPMSADEVYAIA